MRCECGELLLEGIGRRTVRNVLGEEMPFSRRTDHVVCPACLRSYPASTLRPTSARDDPVAALEGLVELQEITDELLGRLRDDETDG
jgi:hypothetical protein